MWASTIFHYIRCKAPARPRRSANCGCQRRNTEICGFCIWCSRALAPKHCLVFLYSPKHINTRPTDRPTRPKGNWCGKYMCLFGFVVLLWFVVCVATQFNGLANQFVQARAIQNNINRFKIIFNSSWESSEQNICVDLVFTQFHSNKSVTISNA